MKKIADVDITSDVGATSGERAHDFQYWFKSICVFLTQSGVVKKNSETPQSKEDALPMMDPQPQSSI